MPLILAAVWSTLSLDNVLDILSRQLKLKVHRLKAYTSTFKWGFFFSESDRVTKKTAYTKVADNSP